MPPMSPDLQIRPHSFYAKKGTIAAFRKVSREFGEAENNVVFGLGEQVLAAAGPFTLSVNTPKNMILRDLTFNVFGAARVRITAITANGEPLLQGGAVNALVFSPTNLNRPPVDMPLDSGTPVTISGDVSAACTVDAAFAID
jgi:hypothetical protein